MCGPFRVVCRWGSPLPKKPPNAHGDPPKLRREIGNHQQPLTVDELPTWLSCETFGNACLAVGGLTQWAKLKRKLSAGGVFPFSSR